MKREIFKQTLDSIFIVEEEEILCSEFAARLPCYAESRLNHAQGAAIDPMMEHHIHQCPECGEVYEGLLEVLGSTINDKV